MPEDEEPPRIIDRRASQRPPAEEGEKEQSNLENNQTQESLAEQLAQEKEKAESYLASWQRAAADFQNYKRRVEQEREEIARISNAALIINMLPLVDDMERALENVDMRLAGMTWLDGIRLIQRKFQALLEMNGVTEIEADGQTFDPNIHEAVMFGEGEEGKVISVVQKGYRLGGRVLRPSLVVVGQGKKAGEQQ
ncbi:MAG TPA: nucleotide exchange factor GrpE [Dehalococcoidia bacterium]|nr:nucleotide exchange factor GrpE [Dehalococcoidia bacterium]